MTPLDGLKILLGDNSEKLDHSGVRSRSEDEDGECVRLVLRGGPIGRW